MALFTGVPEHLSAPNAFILHTGEGIILAVRGGCRGMGTLGDPPGISAGRKAGLASSGREGPWPTQAPQGQNITPPDTVPRVAPPEPSTNVSFGVILRPVPTPLCMPSTVR